MLRALAAALLLLGFAARAEVAVPPLAARVTDLTGTLSESERATLEQKLAAFEARKGSQVAVLMLPSTQPETIEQYAVRVEEAWKLGRKGVDDGVLLVVAKDDRRLRIEVGYGLEGALNDATAKRIIEEHITPRFREGGFHAGIAAGVDRIIAVIDGEPLPAPQQRHGDGDRDLEQIWIFGVALLFVFARILRSIFGRFLGSGLLGGAAGTVASFLIGSVIAGIGIGLVVFVLALIFGAMPAGVSRGRRGSWSPGGFGGSYGGGGFGGGGFSGGGGGSGGGGASGSW